MNLQEAHEKFMQDPRFREEWYKPNMIGMELKIVRGQKGLTQKQLAAMVGTKQPSIARLENSDGYVSLELLHRVARALGKYIKVEIRDAQ